MSIIFDEESIYEISKLCLNNFLTEAWTDGRTEGRTDKPKAICPFNFSKVGGITIKSKQLALSLLLSLSLSLPSRSLQNKKGYKVMHIITTTSIYRNPTKNQQNHTHLNGQQLTLPGEGAKRHFTGAKSSPQILLFLLHKCGHKPVYINLILENANFDMCFAAPNFNKLISS